MEEMNMVQKNAITPPLSETERIEFEALKRQSIVIRKAIGWRRMLELFKDEIQKTYDQVYKWREVGNPNKIKMPVTILEIEGLSLKRLINIFPMTQMPIDLEYSMSPEHLIFEQFR